MKYLIINLSPRLKGTSTMLTEYFQERLDHDSDEVELVRLYQYLNDLNPVLEKIKWADSIIMIGPCYVAAFPAAAVRLLEQMAAQTQVLHGQSLYGFIQGGMPYVHTHEQGIHLLRNYAGENNLIFKGGFVMGGGAPLDGRSLEHVMGAKKIVPAVNTFIERIRKNEESDDQLYRSAAIKIPGVVARLLAFVMNRRIRKTLPEKSAL